MHALPILWIVWGGVAVVLMILLGYRGTLTRYEEDQIFLDEAGKHHEMEQSAIAHKLHKIEPFVRGAVGAACVLSACILAMYLWDAVKQLS